MYGILWPGVLRSSHWALHLAKERKKLPAGSGGSSRIRGPSPSKTSSGRALARYPDSRLLRPVIGAQNSGEYSAGDLQAGSLQIVEPSLVRHGGLGTILSKRLPEADPSLFERLRDGPTSWGVFWTLP